MRGCLADMITEYTFPAVVAGGYDGGRLWVANFPGLSGCWVEGQSREDVVTRAPAALEEYIKCSLEADWAIPEAPFEDELLATGLGEVMLFTVRLGEQ